MTISNSSLRVVELPASVTLVDKSDAASKQSQSNLLEQTLLNALRDRQFYMAETRAFDAPGNTLEEARSAAAGTPEALAITGLLRDARTNSERLETERFVEVTTNSLDPSEASITGDVFNEWRSRQSQTFSRWPVMERFVYGTQMSLEHEKFAEAIALQRESGHVEEESQEPRNVFSDPRVLAERRLHSIGNLYLKDSNERVKRETVFELLHQEGVPRSQAYAQAFLYDTSWSDPLSMPLVEADCMKNVRSGVVHID
jgi:hypothetical protein